jgi:hypothetical protein
LRTERGADRSEPGGGTALFGAVALTRLLQYGLTTFGWTGAADALGTGAGTQLALLAGLEFQRRWEGWAQVVSRIYRRGVEPAG